MIIETLEEKEARIFNFHKKENGEKSKNSHN